MHWVNGLDLTASRDKLLSGLNPLYWRTILGRQTPLDCNILLMWGTDKSAMKTYLQSPRVACNDVHSCFSLPLGAEGWESITWIGGTNRAAAIRLAAYILTLVFISPFASDNCQHIHFKGGFPPSCLELGLQCRMFCCSSCFSFF